MYGTWTVLHFTGRGFHRTAITVSADGETGSIARFVATPTRHITR